MSHHALGRWRLLQVRGAVRLAGDEHVVEAGVVFEVLRVAQGDFRQAAQAHISLGAVGLLFGR
eukprot:3310760-Alexandrium_andersonii.AAC.1